MDNLELHKIDILSFFHEHSNLIFDKKIGNEHYFKKSGQRTGSISVNLAKSFFYDHSDGVGGNIHKAFELFYNGSVFKTSYPKLFVDVPDNTLELISIKEVTSSLLKMFFSEKRKIDLKYLHFVKEIRYKHNGREYFTIGWQNVNKGYNTQNALFKRVLFENGPTILINGKSVVKVNVFESYFDYLAHLTFKAEVDIDAIILNSTSFAKYNFDLEKYKEVDCYFDNDDAGNNATNYFLANYTNAKDKRFYSCKDYNDFIFL